jgi:hypothetical protein
VAARGVGVVVPRPKLSVERLRAAVRAVLEDKKHRSAARELQHQMRQVDGLERASDIIEDALKIGGRPPARDTDTHLKRGVLNLRRAAFAVSARHGSSREPPSPFG